jgi:hypothetical protein
MLSIIKRLGLCLGFALSGCAGVEPGLMGNCESLDGIESICGLDKPEDIVAAPNGRDLIFGEFGEQGSLAVLNTHNKSVRRIYPGSNSSIASKEFWGETNCTTPGEAFQAHGIDLRRRSDGRWQLLVVNHGSRESVEFFELEFGEEDRPRAIWRGCVVMPDQANINDVAALPDGGFLVTHIADKDGQMWQLFLSFFGRNTGFVYRWDVNAGLTVVAGTEGKLPNGILLSPDGRDFFLNVYFDNELRKYNLASGELLGTVDIQQPDNLSWSPRGKLLVASHHASLPALLSSLSQQGSEPSPLPFSIIEVDPESLEKRVLVRREGPPMGAGTVAVELDDFLYIGSYLGDRIIKMAVPASE